MGLQSGMIVSDFILYSMRNLVSKSNFINIGLYRCGMVQTKTIFEDLGGRIVDVYQAGKGYKRISNKFWSFSNSVHGGMQGGSHYLKKEALLSRGRCTHYCPSTFFTKFSHISNTKSNQILNESGLLMDQLCKQILHKNVKI